MSEPEKKLTPADVDEIRPYRARGRKIYVRRYLLTSGRVVFDAWKPWEMHYDQPGATLITANGKYRQATEEETREAVAAMFREEGDLEWRTGAYGGLEGVRAEASG